ncbi:hypothetical protein CC86DRAFT_429870 [Ophiobolus disseminans]|uniref:Uncharacterized protein n=1 Tax=Ophiobolus disseminans TaxID=1469910 RepID=A0A6A6ZF15_9PLEO|nr:hypothetical protein CC86DRAFT_429870 [Ophiobolus disseminans]
MPEPIAIVGSGCRFPGEASSPSKLWELLKEPRDVLREIDRFSVDGFYHKDGYHHGSSNVRHSYQLNEDTREFDAQFFNIPASEADSIDPQQRFLMEVIYEGIENAGLNIEALSGSPTAVYVGVMCNDYAHITYADLESVPKYAATGSALSILSNRVSYFFNWTGPSMTIDTACSSSLVAVHQAVQVLRSGQSKVAVAAGTNLIFTPTNYIAESNVNMLSPTGRSRMWSANADGYARGEGVAAVVLKTLSQAIADGDSIEAIIRETGVNQDGRTPGITMPSSTAQAELIRSTYDRAGLDLKNQSDRPSFFEAHGTGTKAGDPQEARAIHSAFFDESIPSEVETLYVGSIKTIIGHTEGTAGLAGLLKASLAVQNKILPPNMLFDVLNADIEPYYGRLQVLTEPKAWPQLPPGFGGTNAHAIVESYDSPLEREHELERCHLTAVPFMFSGYSEKVLSAQLTTFLRHLDTTQDIELRDLAWTMSERSSFSLRTIVSGSDVDTLRRKVQAKLQAKTSDGEALGARPSNKSPNILGVFTGQGAQWPTMGLGLLEVSSVARESFTIMQQSLAELPLVDRPTWLLLDELAKSAEESKVMQGEFSQVLCTAVQVMLVQVLRSIGVAFDAVVGHSSGEIGAAHAAGYLTARDAIRIAYYRGKYGKLASGRDNVSGSMLAVATSMEDARELCDLEHFEGRLQVAASNSSASVTLSGDVDAVKEAEFIFGDEKKFARALKVDTAYHSYHMLPCAEPYLEAMATCNIEVGTPDLRCRWFSSVLGGEEIGSSTSAALAGIYWRDNLVQPVLFSHALEKAVSQMSNLGLVMEVGPHPALKGPASLTIEEKLSRTVPYTGLLNAVGSVWANISTPIVNFRKVDAICASSSNDHPQFQKTAPNYSWDHDRKFWMEARQSTALRVRVDSPDGIYRWRNFIKPSELPWAKAGFSVMALEAGRAMVQAEEIVLIELIDIEIMRAMTFQDENGSVETQCSLTNIRSDGLSLSADFACDICLSKELHLGRPSNGALPDRVSNRLPMSKVDIEYFYSTLWDLGYNYTGMFRSVTSLKRTTDSATGVIHIESEDDYGTDMLFHPGPLDVAFQTIFGAMGAPGDGRLWTVLVPTKIKRISINPLACQGKAGLGCDLHFDANVSVSLLDGVAGDVDLFDSSGIYKCVQVEGLQVSPLGPVTARDDKDMFSDTTWGLEQPDAARGVDKWTLTEEEWKHAFYVERACFFYLKQLQDTITPEEREKCEWHPRKMLDWATDVVSVVSRGEHPIIKQEWMHDTWEMLAKPLDELTRKYEDFENLTHIGKNLVAFVRGEFSLLELVRNGSLLEHIYRNTYAFAEYNEYLGSLVQQLAHRFPRLDIFEIGAGTGSTTEAILRAIHDQYSSYTYTDISAGFFPQAQTAFPEHASKMVYRIFDATKEPSKQNLPEKAYDLVIASNVLHATPNLEQTLANARKLLKPGGYLVMLEVTDTQPLRPTFFFGCLPGWWVGEADGRQHHPLVSAESWGTIFKRTGFSGLDSVTPKHDVFMAPFSVMLTQAVDSQMNIIRKPLEATGTINVDNLLILGGASFRSYQLISHITSKLKSFVKATITVETLESLTEEHFNPKQVVLSLLELDGPAFEPFTPERFKALQLLTERSRNVVWVVQGSAGEQPYSNMITGVSRCLVGEQPEMQFQILDFDAQDTIDTNYIAESLLRMVVADNWRGFVEPYRPVWMLEREIRYIKSNVYIPRYIPSARRNKQYNSWRRTIRESVDLEDVVVTLTTNNGTHDLERCALAQKHPSPSLDVLSSRVSTKAIEIEDVGRFFIVLGELEGSGQQVLAFSDNNASKLTIKKSHLVLAHTPILHPNQLIKTTLEVCLSIYIIRRAPSPCNFLVHEPSLLLAQILSTEARDTAIGISFTTSDREKTKSGLAFTYLHPLQPDHSFARSLPSNITGFVDITSLTGRSDLGSRIARQLSPSCRRIALDSFSDNFTTVESDTASSLAQILGKSLAYHYKLSPQDGKLDELSLETAIGASVSKNMFQVMNWRGLERAMVRMSPVEDEVTFKSDRTYLLVGLTGELGQSLCHWMVKRGARYIVVTSRKPNVAQTWIDYMASYGALVKTIAMDVTDKKSTFEAVQQVRETLPPITGVANGAMVLNDGLFNVMSHADFEGTLRPKVTGTIFLNQLFDKPDLDFFITFSSLAYVTGNFGQTSYAAANAFMTSVVEGRRKRGLVGSVMHLAGVFGIGYINRTNRNIIERLGKLGYANISEYDFHQFFAEAVLAGPPQSGRCYEVASALRPIDPEQEDNPPGWLDMPRLAYYKVSKRAGIEEGQSKSVSVRAQLKEQTTLQGATEVMTKGLIAKLYKQLGLSPEDGIISPDTSLVDLGIDSLVAVDLRVWFTKELDLDMPVLKLLGGATVAQMVEDTVERMSPTLIPNVAEKNTPVASEAPEAAPITNQSPAVENFNTPGADTVASAKDIPKAHEGDAVTAAGPSVSDIDTVPTSTENSDSSQGTSESSSVTVPSIDPKSCDAGSEDESVATPKLSYLSKVNMGYGPLQFYFMVKHLDDPTILNMQFRLPLKGNMRVPDLSRAVQELGQRHEALRTAFFIDPDNANEPTQGVLETSLLRLETVKVTGADHAKAVCKEVGEDVFDISSGQTIRILLLSMSSISHWLVLAFHHISIDGFSFNILLDELNALYQGQRLQPVTTHFTDVIRKQNQEMRAGGRSSELEYWRQALGRIPDAIPLFPISKVTSRLPITRYYLEEAPMATIGADISRKIRKQCNALRITKFQFFMTVLREFLFAFLDTDELCIGFADANRSDPSVAHTVGYLVNLLSLRFERAADQTFKQKVEDVKKKSYAALANSSVPFNALLDKLDVPRSATHSPVFQVFMDYISHRFPLPDGLGVIEEEVSAHLTHNFFDLGVDVNDVTGKEIHIRFRGQQYLYAQSGVKFLLKSFVRLVKLCADMPASERINKPALYDPADIENVMKWSQGNAVPLQWPSTAMQRINEVVTDSKNHTALVDDQGHTLPYTQMMERSQRLASSLIDAGVQQHQVVGVYQQPGADSVCSILAIWSIGATYLPLDTRVVSGRLQQIVADCEPSAILCHKHTIEAASQLGVSDESLIDVSALKSKTSVVSRSVDTAADDIAVILYTSGSTGTPKGLPIRHTSLMNQIKAITDKFAIGAEIVLQQSAASFDVALHQVFICLFNGGTLHIASHETRLDSLQITKMIAARKITWVYATPSELSQWIGHGLPHLSSATSLRYVFSGGETLTKSLVKDIQKKLNRPGLRLINVYGPAEAGVVTSTEIDLADSEGAISIGRPLSNIAVYVVDKDLRPVPAGVSGEILIAGAGNIESYLKKPELSATSFIKDTLTPSGLYQGQLATMYRSGDMGRYEADGQLYFKGRIAGNLQVKVNGVRVELEDIERSIIDAADGVITTAVAVVKHNPDFLVAFVEFVQDLPGAQKQDFLKVLLRRLPLPRCMTPAMLIATDIFPLNSHGKLDRRAVEALPLPQGAGEDDGPMNETELALRDVWTGCLPESIVKATCITSLSDFFHLGGNSYLLVHLQRLIRQRFNVHVPVMSLYDASSLASMARRINSGESVVAIDWQAETSVTKALLAKQAGVNFSDAQPLLPSRKTSGLTVVMTGATGYMGSRILQSLTDDDRVAIIHCVALREHTESSPRVPASQSQKLRLHAGNFSEQRLGLTQQDFDTLADTADLIVHSGANRAFWDYYDNLRGPNVNSTKTLVELAAIRRMPVHFISSGGVHLLRDNADAGIYPTESVAAFPPPSDGSNGYIASKWASEVYLENAAKELSIPVSIHRFVPATADTDSAPPGELLEELRDLALRLKALPAPSGWVGTFDLSPADALAAELEVTEGGEAAVEALERLPPLQWAGRAKKEGLSWHFTSTDFVAMGGVEGMGLRR